MALPRGAVATYPLASMGKGEAAMTLAGWPRARHSPRATRRRHDGGKTADDNVAATAPPIADRFIS